MGPLVAAAVVDRARGIRGGSSHFSKGRRRDVEIGAVEAAPVGGGDEVNAESSTVVFDNGLHWMAMSKMNGTRFYFDSNDGLYSVDTQDEYRALVDMFIDDYKNLPGYTNRYDVYSISG